MDAFDPLVTPTGWPSRAWAHFVMTTSLQSRPSELLDARGFGLRQVHSDLSTTDWYQRTRRQCDCAALENGGLRQLPQ